MNNCNLLPRARWIRRVEHNPEQRKETKLLSLSADNNITSQSSLAVRFPRNEMEKEKVAKCQIFLPEKALNSVPSFFPLFKHGYYPGVLRHFSTLPKSDQDHGVINLQLYFEWVYNLQQVS